MKTNPIRKNKSKNKKPIVIIIILVIAIVAASAIIFVKFNYQNQPETKPEACTVFEGNSRRHCADEYLGLTNEQATAEAKEDGLIPQTISVDGILHGVLDIGGPTIYFKVNDNIVTGVCFRNYIIHEGVCSMTDWASAP